MSSFLSEVAFLVLNCTTVLYLIFECGAASAALSESDRIATFQSGKRFAQWSLIAALITTVLVWGTVYVFFAVVSTLQSLTAGFFAGALAVKCFLDGRASYRTFVGRHPPA